MAEATFFFSVSTVRLQSDSIFDLVLNVNVPNLLISSYRQIVEQFGVRRISVHNQSKWIPAMSCWSALGSEPALVIFGTECRATLWNKLPKLMVVGSLTAFWCDHWRNVFQDIKMAWPWTKTFTKLANPILYDSDYTRMARAFGSHPLFTAPGYARQLNRLCVVSFCWT